MPRGGRSHGGGGHRGHVGHAGHIGHSGAGHHFGHHHHVGIHHNHIGGCPPPHHHIGGGGFYGGGAMGAGRHHAYGGRGGGIPMTAEQRKFMVTRYIISGLVSVLISLPLVVIGVLLIIDIWKINSQYMGYILVSTGAIGLVGGLVGLVMAATGVCGPRTVAPGAAMQVEPYYPNPVEPVKPPVYTPTNVVQQYPQYGPQNGLITTAGLQPGVHHPASAPAPPVIQVHPSPPINDGYAATLGTTGTTGAGTGGVAGLAPVDQHTIIRSPPPRYYSPSPRPTSPQRNVFTNNNNNDNNNNNNNNIRDGSTV